MMWAPTCPSLTVNMKMVSLWAQEMAAAPLQLQLVVLPEDCKQTITSSASLTLLFLPRNKSSKQPLWITISRLNKQWAWQLSALLKAREDSLHPSKLQVQAIVRHLKPSLLLLRPQLKTKTECTRPNQHKSSRPPRLWPHSRKHSKPTKLNWQRSSWLLPTASLSINWLKNVLASLALI